jgi:hypothetical protein
VGAFLLGGLDGATGGLSSMILGATVPGYDCFIKAHDTAFQAGSVIAQVVVVAVMIVGTLGAGTLLVAAKYLATAGIKAAIKTALKAVKQLAVSGAKSLLRKVESRTAQTAGRASGQAAEEAAASGARFVAGPNGVTDLVPNARDAISIGRFADGYLDDAAASGARAFNLGDNWGAMAARTDRFGGLGPNSEIWIRNQRFLDDAIGRGSFIRVVSDPFASKNAGSFFVREFNYLMGRGVG